MHQNKCEAILSKYSKEDTRKFRADREAIQLRWSQLVTRWGFISIPSQSSFTTLLLSTSNYWKELSSIARKLFWISSSLTIFFQTSWISGRYGSTWFGSNWNTNCFTLKSPGNGIAKHCQITNSHISTARCIQHTWAASTAGIEKHGVFHDWGLQRRH